jgi:hypothetical protein
MQHAVRPRRVLDLAATRPVVLGGTTISADTLAVGDISHFSATLGGGGPVSVAAGANLGGYGSVVGDVTNNGVTAGRSESLRNGVAAAPAVAPTHPALRRVRRRLGRLLGRLLGRRPVHRNFSRRARRNTYGHAARDRCAAGRVGVTVQRTFGSEGTTWQPYVRGSVL